MSLSAETHCRYPTFTKQNTTERMNRTDRNEIVYIARCERFKMNGTRGIKGLANREFYESPYGDVIFTSTWIKSPCKAYQSITATLSH